jgi:cytoskeleton protein RodZ
MPTFGENLRREREMRGVTLEEISESTKISTRLLKALETDQFSELPGGIFTRNFIRAYAQYLGLDEEHALAEYKRVAGAPTDNDLSRLTPSRPLSHAMGARARLLPWVVIAVLLGAGYAVYHYNHRAVEIKPLSIESSPPNDSQPASDGSTPGGAAGAGGNPANSTTTPASNAGSSPATSSTAAAGKTPDNSVASQPAASSNAGANPASAAPVLGEGDLVLQVSTTEDAWLAVAADGKTLWQHQFPANSTRTFRAKDFFDVTTGNAQGTALTLNGQAQKPLGREGEFRRIHLTRDNLQAQSPAH